MNKMIFAALIAMSAVAHAETELTCWNMYAKKGAAPVLKAQIGEGNALTITLNAKDSFFESYVYNDDVMGMVDGQYVSIGRQTETIVSPEGEIAPELLGKRSPVYKGNNSYDLEKIGHHTYDTANYKHEGDLSAQLILPVDLSSDALKDYRIRSQNERSNAVMVLPGPANSNQGGSSYLRMFCVSK